jgi:hypothetical protein
MLFITVEMNCTISNIFLHYGQYEIGPLQFGRGPVTVPLLDTKINLNSRNAQNLILHSLYRQCLECHSTFKKKVKNGYEKIEKKGKTNPTDQKDMMHSRVRW